MNKEDEAVCRHGAKCDRQQHLTVALEDEKGRDIVVMRVEYYHVQDLHVLSTVLQCLTGR